MTITLLTMGLFGFFKKTPAPKPTTQVETYNPYTDSATNYIYNLLFCDDLELYKANTQPPYSYPFDILFAETSSMADLQKIIDDVNTEPRIKVLAYNKQLAHGNKSSKKELLGVIVEVGLDEGLDVLASFKNGTARYINHSGKMMIWEKTDDAAANDITKDLFTQSQQIVNQIGPWDKPRKQYPTKGNARITFLVSDGLTFGEGPTDLLFNDPMGGAALTTATKLMQYLTEKALKAN